MKEKISPAIPARAREDGSGQPVIKAILTPDRVNKRQNGRRFKEEGEPSFTLTGQDIHGIIQIGTRLDSNSGTQPFQQDRVYNPEGISPALQQGLPGGSHKIKIQPAQLVNKNRAEKPYNPNNREMKIKIRDDETSYTIKSATHECMVKQGIRIRRYTPLECERLQGFPEEWTKGFSETQRYKMMGNAVTVNVIRAIASKLLKN